MVKYISILLIAASFQLCFGQPAPTLVLPGDYADPSVVKIGDSYWATATTSNWAPIFPLLESKDLLKWELKGHVFTTLPAWADYYFWAPEIAYEDGKVYVFYSAHKKGGNLCLSVASASSPAGPFTDHGPLMCEEAGSIDAFTTRDENGKLYIIWKEDGNSVKKPTPIWAAPLSEDRTKIIGDKKELFRNDTEWERNLVEGVSIIRHGQYFYAFYAGAGCCGRGCSYATGVARSKQLLGPWEKYDKNPILAEGEKWKCPGHGTPVEKDGKYYFLYHGYNKKSDVYVGRQGLLNEFIFTADDWVEFKPTSKPDAVIADEIKDDFSTKSLSSRWQWSVYDTIDAILKDGKLSLKASDARGGSFIALKTMTENYEADAKIVKSGTSSGIALIGDDNNMVSMMVSGRQITISKLFNKKETVLMEKPIKDWTALTLRIRVEDGRRLFFSYSTDGKMFNKLEPSGIDAQDLPPWDRALRIGVVARGEETGSGIFDSFVLRTATMKP
jgi:beta-xylosidase